MSSRNDIIAKIDALQLAQNELLGMPLHTLTLSERARSALATASDLPGRSTATSRFGDLQHLARPGPAIGLTPSETDEIWLRACAGPDVSALMVGCA